MKDTIPQSTPQQRGTPRVIPRANARTSGSQKPVSGLTPEMLQLNPPLPTLPTLKPEADLWQDWERWNGPAKKSQPAIGAQQSVSNPHDASQDKKPEQKKQRYTVDMTPVHDSYKLSPGDSLMVRMNGEKLFGELNGGITIIAADGSVMFDKIYGPVKVGELTIE